MASAEEYILNIKIPTGPADAATDALDRLQAAGGAAEAALGAAGAAAAVAGIRLRGLDGRFISKEALAGLAQAIPGFEGLATAAKAAALAEGAAAAGLAKVAAAAKTAGAAGGDKVKADTASEKSSEKAMKAAAKAAADKIKLDEKMLRQTEKLAAADENAAANDSIEGKIKGMAGAMENANGVTGKLTAALRTLGPVGAVIATVLAAVIAVVGAVIIAFRDLAAAAISISQEKDALSATFKALSTGSESGRELVDSLSEVAAALPFAEGKVLAWGKSLMSAGIEGQGLTSAVNAVAAATALMGEEGGQSVINMEKQLAEAGAAADMMMKTIQGGGKKSVNMLSSMGLQSHDLAAALGVTDEKFKTMKVTAEQMSGALEKALIEKGAGALEAMGLTWESISGKMSDGVEDLFEDMGSAVRPFMAEVRSLFSELFAGSTTMSTTKDIITAVLTEVFAIATQVVNGIHKGFLTIEIAAFKVAAALWPIISVIIAIATNATFLAGLTMALKGIGAVILVVVAVLAVMFVTINMVIAFFGMMVGAVLSAAGLIVGALMWCVGDAVRAFGVMVDAVSGFASGAYDAAGNFVSGIVNGITNGVGAVVAAVKGLASSAMGAFTGFFKIHSPSGLMTDKAEEIPAGAVVGVENGTGDLENAMTDMSTAGMGGASKGFSKGGRGASGGGDTYYITVEYSGKREDNPDLFAQLLGFFEQARSLAPRTT